MVMSDEGMEEGERRRNMRGKRERERGKMKKEGWECIPVVCQILVFFQFTNCNQNYNINKNLSME